MNDESRPDPDALLRAIQREEVRERSGQLRIFFGMAAGVGKTYAMLKAAHQRLAEGVDVVIGTIDTHGRKETLALVDNIPFLPRKKIDYRGTALEEMDLDAILARKPQLVLVDELAHSNAPGSRHHKRYQDVLELLDQGINVYTTLNVQHLESRKEAVEQISGVLIRETVPDSIFERATQVDLVDLAPAELLRRLREGKVYLGERAQAAEQNFFKEAPLTALREIALRITAEKVDQELQGYMEAKQIQGPWRATERLMVAISHSPYSERLIRATRRIAYNLEAPWIAVYIDTGRPLRADDQAQLAKNMALVQELGGELLATTETDLPSALKRIAQQKNVTQLIVGRPTRRLVKDLIEGGSLLDRLVRESGEFDVHVIRQDSTRVTPTRWWADWAVNSSVEEYVHVTWCLIIVAVLNFLVEPLAGYKAVGFIFLLAVLALSLFNSMGPILFAAAASSLIWDYFFIPPHLTLYISEKEDFMMCAMYFIAALTTGLLTRRIRQHQKLLRDKEEKTNLLYQIVSDIAHSRKRFEFIESIESRVGFLLNGRCAIFIRSDSGGVDFTAKHNSFGMDEKEKAVASWAFQQGKPAGWSTDTLSEAGALYLPLKGQEIVGLLAFQPKSRGALGQDRESLLSTVARQVAISVEREIFEEQAVQGERLKESEQLHQTLLNSISHELRTPLTSILGAATAMSEAPTVQNDAHAQALLNEVIGGSERLNRVVENLLDMTRLSSGVLSLKLEWHDIQDLVGVTIQKSEKILTHHRVTVEMAEVLPLVKMDFRLMEHALSNLMINAALYSGVGTEIKVSAVISGTNLQLSVADRGPGIPPESFTQIFEKFYRLPGTPAGGTGLGLPIAKSIVEAHAGRVFAQNRAEGGACFTIELPLGESPRIVE